MKKFDLKEANYVNEINKLNMKFEAAKKQWLNEKDRELNLLAETLDLKLNEEYTKIMIGHRDSMNQLINEKELLNQKLNDLINNNNNNKPKVTITKVESSSQCNLINNNNNNNDELIDKLKCEIKLLKQLVTNKDEYYEQDINRLRKKLKDNLNSSFQSYFNSDANNQNEDNQIEELITTTTTTTTTLVIKYNNNNE